MESLAEKAAKLAAIDALAANFGAEIPAALKIAWLDLLRGYSVQQVENGVKAVILDYEYKTMPPFAVLQAALDDLRGLGGKALKLQAIAEWAQLYEAISYFGYYSKPKLHPTTEYVLRLLGGWQTACMWKSSELEFRRKDFVLLWMESHGRLEVLELGAEAVRNAMASGCVNELDYFSETIPRSKPHLTPACEPYIEPSKEPMEPSMEPSMGPAHWLSSSGNDQQSFRDNCPNYSSCPSYSSYPSCPSSCPPSYQAGYEENPQASYKLGLPISTASMANGVEE